MVWEMFDRDGAGGFQICGVDGDALAQSPVTSLPVACEITVRADSAAPEMLAATERDIERTTTSLGGRIVATSRTRTTLVTLAYLPSDDDAEWFSKISLPRRASVSVAPAIDPEWTLFERTRPEGIEAQSMLDFRVRSELFAAGDVGGARPIEHVVRGLTPTTTDDFTVSVSAAIADLRRDVAGAEVGSWHGIHVADPKDVTDSSWMIRQIAERFGASYDGWGCAVVTGVEPKRRRGWFR